MSNTAVRSADARSASPGSPDATRLVRSGWRDPRLAVGLVLVAAATLTGARLASSGDTVTVWATTAPVRAGAEVADVELAPSRVALDDAGSESSYLSSEQTPTGVFARDLAAGELVPVGALEQTQVTGRADLSLAVAVGDAPVDLAEGELVDVYAVPDPALSGQTGSRRADRVLEAVPVMSVQAGPALGAAARQVVVGLDDERDDLGRVLGALAAGSVVLVRVGG